MRYASMVMSIICLAAASSIAAVASSAPNSRTAAVAKPDFYKESREHIEQTLARLETLQGELARAYARWAELEAR